VSDDTLRGTTAGTGRKVTWRLVAVLATLTVCAVAPYLAGVLIPYYVNDLDELPLSEVASGAHDPKDLWPQGTVGRWVQSGGYLSLGLTPLMLLFVLALCVGELGAWRPREGPWRMSPGVAAGLVVVAAVCIGVLIAMFSPMGAALATWRMD
jgi:hypothetical protein